MGVDRTETSDSSLGERALCYPRRLKMTETRHSRLEAKVSDEYMNLVLAPCLGLAKAVFRVSLPGFRECRTLLFG